MTLKDATLRPAPGATVEDTAPVVFDHYLAVTASGHFCRDTTKVGAMKGMVLQAGDWPDTAIIYECDADAYVDADAKTHGNVKPLLGFGTAAEIKTFCDQGGLL